MFTPRIAVAGWLAVAAMFATSAFVAANIPTALTERPFQGPSTGTVRATLRCATPKVKIGDYLKLDIEFTVGGGAWLYNPQQESFIPNSGHVNLYDADGQFVCDLAVDMLGGSRDADHRYFHWLEQDQTFRSRKSVIVNDTHPAGAPRQIKPGKHHVQLVYDEGLFAYPINFSAATPEARRAWLDSFKKSEVLRSNAVTIEIIR